MQFLFYFVSSKLGRNELINILSKSGSILNITRQQDLFEVFWILLIIAMETSVIQSIYKDSAVKVLRKLHVIFRATI